MMVRSVEDDTSMRVELFNIHKVMNRSVLKRRLRTADWGKMRVKCTLQSRGKMQTIVNTYMYPPPPPESRTHAVYSLGVGDNV